MTKKKAAIKLPSVDSLFTSQEERDSERSERVTLVPVDAVEPFPGHPFRVADDEEMKQLADSVATHGVLVPLTVRPLGSGRYGLVSRHRRKRAAEIAGLAEVPCVVRDMDDDEAVIAMVDSNLQRETILPSERAFAYSMRLEAMKRQGQRTDLTSVQLEQKSGGRWSRSILAEELGTSEAKVQRFVRLTFLAPALLRLVDEGRMKMLPAVELSYLAQGLLQGRLRQPSRCILVSSHNLSEVAAVADELVFVREGRIVAISPDLKDASALESLYEHVFSDTAEEGAR